MRSRANRAAWWVGQNPLGDRVTGPHGFREPHDQPQTATRRRRCVVLTNGRPRTRCPPVESRWTLGHTSAQVVKSESETRGRGRWSSIDQVLPAPRSSRAGRAWGGEALFVSLVAIALGLGLVEFTIEVG